MRRSKGGTARQDEASVLALIDGIYAAGLDGALWPRALESLALATGSATAVVTLFDAAMQHGEVAWHYGGDPSLRDAYENHWAAHNPYLQAGIPLQRAGLVTQGESLIPDSVAKRSAYYNEFLCRAGIWYHTGICIEWAESFRALLFLNRSLHEPSHSPQEVALLRALTPHLQRAVAMYRRLRGLELERAASESALNQLPFAVFMLGPRGQVGFHNIAAGEMLAQRDGLTLTRNGLHASHAACESALQRSIHAACGDTQVDSTGGWTQIPRPSGRRSYVAFVSPVRLPDRLLGLQGPRAIAFVSDPDRAPEALSEALCRLFRLTPAEISVVQQLAAGLRPAEVAEQLGISEHTARTHMKRIFDKLDVRTQAQLIRTLLGGIPGLRGAGREDAPD